MTMTAIDLTRVDLTEGGPTWLHAFAVGRHASPVHGVVTLTRERLQHIADGVNRGVQHGRSIAVDWDHRQDTDEAGKTAGWIEGAEVRGDGLWIAVAFTDEARTDVRSGAWRYLSPEFRDWTDPRTGHQHPDILIGAALTNLPFPRELTAVSASEQRAYPTPARGREVLDRSFGSSDRGDSPAPAAAPTPAAGRCRLG